MRTLLAAAAFLLLVSPARAADRAAAPSTFASVYSAAQAGDTITLAEGSYGTWVGGTKAVTVQAASGAVVSLKPNFSAADGITLKGLTVPGGRIGGTSKNVTITGSNFTDLLLIETTAANAGIVLDGNRHVNLDACASCIPARVTVWASGTPSGVTVKNSLFQGGDADGVRPDSDGVQVIGNEFADIIDKGGNHADPIQIYGGTRAVIRGNYFHNAAGNISAYIMQADGGTGNLIEDNVFAKVNGNASGGNGVGYGITLYSDNGSIIRHNTFQRGTCDFNIPCGTLSLGNKTGQPKSKGTVIRDNILSRIDGGSGTYTADHNLTTGSPAYVAPFPAAYGDFQLALGSIGSGAASDGLDVGARFVAPIPTPTPTATPTATATASPTPTATPEPTPPPYAPACAPDCDATILSLRTSISAAAVNAEQALVSLSQARADRDAATADRDELAAKIAAAIAALN